VSHLSRPDRLTEAGNLAHDIITRFLEEKGLADTGLPDNCGSVFRSPEEWAADGEEYGHDSVLIVTHDGGDHAKAFDWNREQYPLIEELRQNLAPYGMYVEQCTSWYSAVYHRPTSEKLAAPPYDVTGMSPSDPYN
jgi:hypothetical protein